MRRPAILVHGAWHGPWVWDEWLPLLRQAGYAPRPIALRGHDGPGNGYRGVRLRDYRDDLRRAVAGTEEDPVLIGHSLGGLLVAHLLADRSFPAAVLLAPVPGRYPPSVIARFARRHPLAMARATLGNDLRALVATPRLAREALFTEDTPEDVVRRCQPRLTGAWPGLFRELVATAPPEPRPGTPTLLLAPERDDSFRLPMQRAFAGRLGAELEVVPGCGHDVPVDAPWREAARRVLAWLP